MNSAVVSSKTAPITPAGRLTMKQVADWLREEAIVSDEQLKDLYGAAARSRADLHPLIVASEL